MSKLLHFCNGIYSSSGMPEEMALEILEFNFEMSKNIAFPKFGGGFKIVRSINFISWHADIPEDLVIPQWRIKMKRAIVGLLMLTPLFRLRKIQKWAGITDEN